MPIRLGMGGEECGYGRGRSVLWEGEECGIGGGKGEECGMYNISIAKICSRVVFTRSCDVCFFK